MLPSYTVPFVTYDNDRRDYSLMHFEIHNNPDGNGFIVRMYYEHKRDLYTHVTLGGNNPAIFDTIKSAHLYLANHVKVTHANESYLYRQVKNYGFNVYRYRAPNLWALDPDKLW